MFIQIVQVQYLNDESKFINGTWKTIVSLLLLGGMEFLFIFFGADFFSRYLFPTISLLPIFLKLMSLLIVVILLSNFFAMVYLPCSGNTLFLSRVLIFVSIVSVVVAPILIWLYAGYG
ncbi:flippase, partial [Escherichia coli]